MRFVKSRFGQNNQATVKSDFIKVPPLINNLLFLILKIEMMISLIVPFTFGLSFIVVAKKVAK